MDAGEDQNTATTNGNPQASGSCRTPQIAHMSLYERQAVQALQALQRQPNAAQYFQQLMLQQQFNSAQLHNLAAVQQATLAASRQSSTSSNSMTQVPTSVNPSTTSAGGTMSSPRPHGPATSATTTTLNHAPSDNDQVQNMTLHCASSTKPAAVKSEVPDKKDASSFPLSQQQQSVSQTAQKQQLQPQQPQQMTKSSYTQQSTSNPMSVKTVNQTALTVTPAAAVPPPSSSSPALPLSQLLLTSTASPVILMPTTNVATSSQGYPIGSVVSKANINTQTLVVQPLQQAGSHIDKGPVPIQPKTAQGHRFPVQLTPRQPTPILPAPPSNSHNPPHIPVQLVGARQSMAGNAQAVALGPVRSSTTQENTPGGNTNTASNNIHPADGVFSSPPTLSLPLPLSRACDRDRAPLPQAVVKPQVLTHLIEGFVIQEGAEPFPVAGLLKDRNLALAGLLKCEYCGNLAPASQFKGSKRFCTNTCAKRYNVSCSQHYKSSRERNGSGPALLRSPSESAVRRRGPSRRSSSSVNRNKISSKHLPTKCHSESSRSEDLSSDGEEDESTSLSPSSSHSCSRADHSAPQSDSSGPGSLPLEGAHFLSTTPSQWSVEEVCRFISSLQGCEELAAQFLSQEIDGQALLLLREDHLISTMNIKLGPALKICASINSLRE
uniref:Polyhomeotic-like protein 1 n=1 Tax=Gouania willdenowi TaxID=441366 RepID=A0A8C5DWT0_GOUWI